LLKHKPVFVDWRRLHQYSAAISYDDAARAKPIFHPVHIGFRHIARFSYAPYWQFFHELALKASRSVSGKKSQSSVRTGPKQQNLTQGVKTQTARSTRLTLAQGRI
jgi:hypothetical protein